MTRRPWPGAAVTTKSNPGPIQAIIIQQLPVDHRQRDSVISGPSYWPRAGAAMAARALGPCPGRLPWPRRRANRGGGGGRLPA